MKNNYQRKLFGRTKSEGARIGFIIANLLQLLHFSTISRHLDGEVVVYVEVRPDHFGITKELIRKHMGNCRIRWVQSADLKSIDGECDVLVCQTPIPILKFFEKSLVVAEQYSLAKEQYQYGLWRAHASLNLMYGAHSVAAVSRFCHAIPVGNPLLDGHIPKDGLRPLVEPSDPLRVLYMPTYGDLSDRSRVLDTLLRQGVDLRIKAHHADFEIKDLAEAHELPIHLSDSNPIELIAKSDLVVSDYSGAIYDALAMRTPVALTETLNHDSSDVKRLSSEDLSRSSIMGLASPWLLDEPLRAAHERSWGQLSLEENYAGFMDKFFVNLGSAAPACVEALMSVANNGVPADPVVEMIRAKTEDYITKNRELTARVKRAESRSARAGFRFLGQGAVSPGKRKRQALYSMLRNDPPQTVVLKSTRYVLRRVPGGNSILRRLQRLRGHISKGRLKGRGSARSNAAQAGSDLSPRPCARRIQIMRLVQGYLDDHGVDYRVSANRYWAYIAVQEEDVQGLFTALTSIDFTPDLRVKLWLGSGARYNTVQYTDTLRFSDLVSCQSLVLGIPDESAGSAGQVRTSGVEILLLEPREDRLVARRARAEKPDWTLDFAQPAEDTNSNRTSISVQSRSATRPINPDDEAVDVVYTWVDSNDPEWIGERAKWSGQSEIIMASAANDERYLDREELRFSLRSIWLYAPFVRNVYIVTHGHRPSWLVEDNERIRVVSHQEIFPDLSVLPTFNSHSIEACLHRIPGLSEKFLYLNDDFFLGRDTTYGDFFTAAGLSKSRFSPSSFVADLQPSPEAIPTDWASYNSVKLIEEDFGLTFDRKHKHVPYVLLKSVLEEMEERYPAEFERTRGSRFRHHDDYAIPSMLAHYYGVATGRAVEWENVPLEYVYADTGKFNFEHRMGRIKSKRPKFVCFNSTLHRDIDLETQTVMLREFLESQYPVPSPYEISAEQDEG